MRPLFKGAFYSFVPYEGAPIIQGRLLIKGAHYLRLYGKSDNQKCVYPFSVFRDAFQSLSCAPLSQKRSTSILRSQSRKILKPPRDDRLSWPALLRADNKELSRMVTGLNNTVKALNDYLVELLQERDVLHNQQDEMLENISELTDHLL